MAPRVSAQFRVEVQPYVDYAALIGASSLTRVAYWRLGEASGPTTVDASGNGRDGTAAGGVTFGQPGMTPDHNTAVRFDGLTGTISMGNVVAAAFTGAFTVEAWVKMTATSALSMIVSKSAAPAGWGLAEFSGNGKFQFFAYTSAPAAVFDLQTVAQYNNGLWHHVVGTWTGTTATNGVKLYVDGGLAAQATAAAGTVATNAAPLRISGWDTVMAGPFSGTVDEVALYSGVMSAAEVMSHYLVGQWTDLTRDVLTEVGIHFVRGINGNGPLDRTADPGRLEFSLRNDKGNTGKTRSWYSPNHPQVRSGWQEGIPARLMARYQGVDYPVWRGKIITIDPTAGDAPQRVAVVAQDAIADFTEAQVREIPPQIDQSEVALLQAVLDALPVEAQPVAVNFDAALDEYPLAFDAIGAGTAALGLMNDAVTNAVGTLFVSGDGTLTYINRHSEALADSVLTLVDEDLLVRGPGFVGSSSLANVFNRVRITIHEKDEVASVLFLTTATVELAPGESFEVWDTYSDPNNRNRLIGAKSFTPLAATTDYTANTAEDGSGDDRTANLSIAISTFSTIAKSVLSNTGTDTLIVTMRQLRGIGIFDNAPQTLESFMPEPYGDRPLAVDLQFQTDATVAQDLADYLVAQFSDRTRQGEELVYDPHRSAMLMLAALTADVGDVVTASEQQTGLDTVDLLIRGIAGEIESGPYGFALTMRYRVVPRIASASFIFDDPVFGVFDSSVAVLGYA